MRHRTTALRRLVVAGTTTVALALGAGVPVAAAAPAVAAPSTATAPSAAVVTSRAPSAGFDAEPLRKLLTPLPGYQAGALVRVDGPGRGPLWTGVAGPVPTDAHFRIGSVTKAFTHTVALQLVAEHRMGIDDPVRSHLPELIPAEYGGVTVRQILDHTSGFPAPAPTPSPRNGPGWWLTSVTPVDGIRDAFALAAVDEAWRKHRPAPGTVQQYNGLNTLVAGLLVEKVTGNSFRQELDRRILRPLRLRDTSLPAADDITVPSPHARVYVGADEVTEQSPYPWAEGGMISTAADLDRFLTALLGGRLLPPAVQRLAFSVPEVPGAPQNKHCGTEGRACFAPVGLMRLTLGDGVTVWGKTGSRPGWENGFFATPDLKRRVVYSLNPTGTGTGEEYTGYVRALVGAAFTGVPPTAPASMAPASIASAPTAPAPTAPAPTAPAPTAPAPTAPAPIAPTA
ncbi:serine hydrolase domain-containing protein [Streptomyces sp. NPDC053513]|uniref:serine hydrolase domain-containing protein n=1 Tax=unclassified Streptomyces TaxID=2593676 RepID=UPI0037D290AD